MQYQIIWLKKKLLMRQIDVFGGRLLEKGKFILGNVCRIDKNKISKLEVKKK